MFIESNHQGTETYSFQWNIPKLKVDDDKQMFHPKTKEIAIWFFPHLFLHTQGLFKKSEKKQNAIP